MKVYCVPYLSVVCVVLKSCGVSGLLRISDSILDEKLFWKWTNVKLSSLIRLQRATG